MASNDPPDDDAHAPGDESVISLVEEVLKVDIHTRSTGRARVTTRTESISDNVGATLESRGIEVTRVPVGRDLEPGAPIPGLREEGDTTILPVFEEILIVEKRLRLVEEIHIRRTLETEDVSVPVTRRRQVAEIERDDFPAKKSSPEIQ